MKKLFTILITLHASLFTLHTAYSQVINVPADQATIQAGINVATDGDTVLVADGTYPENINFRGKAIIVASHFLTDPDTNHIYNTVIDGSSPIHTDSAAVVMFISGEDTASILYGFTLTGGSGLNSSFPNGMVGGGISCDESGAKIMHNRIINNELLDNPFSLGGGIYSTSMATEPWIVIGHNYIADNVASATTVAAGGGLCLSSSARVFGNTITRNEAICTGDKKSAEGGGIACESMGELDVLLFSNNEITYNTDSACYVYGVGMCIYNSHTVIKNNDISHNIATGNRSYGSAIRFMFITGDVLIEDNTFHDNSHESDTVALAVVNLRGFLNNDADVRLLNNSFKDNSASAYYSWAAASTVANSFDAKVIVDGNIITGHSGARAGGFYLFNAYNVQLTNNVFSGDSVTHLGGALYFHQTEGSTQTQRSLIANNTFYNNYAGYRGGAVFFSPDYDNLCPVFMNNIFWENDCGSGLGEDIFYQGSEDLWLESNNINVEEIHGDWDGRANFSMDPEFIDDSCHIPQNGSCVDKGSDSLFYDGYWYMAPLVDYEGDPRPDTICNKVDIGADERLDGLSPGIDDVPYDSKSITLTISPNPTNQISDIRYHISDISHISLQVIDVRGHIISSLVGEVQRPGDYILSFDASGLPAGVYFIRLRAADATAVRKVVVSH